MSTKKMFKNLAKGCIINRNGKVPIDLSTLPTDATCKSLYLEGFRHIGITEDASDWLKTLSKQQLELLIKTKKTQKKTADVKILEKVMIDCFSMKKKVDKEVNIKK